MSPTGWLGTGLMGKAMARRVLDRGQPVVVWNRTAGKTAPLTAAGAGAAATPAEVAARCPVVVLCLAADAVADVVFGPEGLAAGTTGSADAVGANAAGAPLVVDHTTMHPARAAELATRWHGLTGGSWVDAPVTGGVPGAEQGTLTVFAGGDPADIERARAVVGAYARACHATGGVGAGQAVKMCNQVLVGAIMWSLAEATALAGAAGLDPARLPEWLRDCPVDSGLLRMMQPLMAAGIAKSGLLSMTRVVDDLHAALELSRTAGAPMPLTACVAELLRIANLWTPPDELCRFADLLTGPSNGRNS
jgi:3-hydroxyisobutyrate dehydrogenase-like beta-hydroxyacid dehydrogenase